MGITHGLACWIDGLEVAKISRSVQKESPEENWGCPLSKGHLRCCHGAQHGSFQLNVMMHLERKYVFEGNVCLPPVRATFVCDCDDAKVARENQ